MCAYTLTHTLLHTHSLSYTQIHTHSLTHTHKHTRSHTHTQHAHTHTHTQHTTHNTHTHTTQHTHSVPGEGGDKSAPLEDGYSIAGDAQPQIHTVMILSLEQLHSIKLQPTTQQHISQGFIQQQISVQCQCFIQPATQQHISQCFIQQQISVHCVSVS